MCCFPGFKLVHGGSRSVVMGAARTGMQNAVRDEQLVAEGCIRIAKRTCSLHVWPSCAVAGVGRLQYLQMAVKDREHMPWHERGSLGLMAMLGRHRRTLRSSFFACCNKLRV